MTAPLVEARQVTKAFGAVSAVVDVSMQVGPGEVVGLLGANGAGKTTLLRLLLGLLAPSDGQVALLGGAPDRAHRRGIGYVPQGGGLWPDLTVSENLRFVERVYGVPVSPPWPTLVPVADRPAGRIPLGLQRQLAFACALTHRPTVLVLDEPTSGVDPLARARLWDTIRRQAEDGVGVLVTTHHMQEAEQCDRLLLMSAGRLVAQGSEADIVGSTRAIAVASDSWRDAFSALDAAGLPVALAGTAVRVVDTPSAEVAAALDAAGVPADLSVVPATINERMTMLARAATL